MNAIDLSTLTDGELVAYIGGMHGHDDPIPAGAYPASLAEAEQVLADREYAVVQRRLLVDLCTIYGAGNTAGALEDVDADGCGGLLLDFPPIPPRPGTRSIDGCADLAKLTDDAYRGAL